MTGAAAASSAPFRVAVNALCAALPGAEWSESFGPGHDVWKVGGRMFAAMGTADPGVSVKTPDIETASMLIDAGVGARVRHLHRSWVRVREGVAADERAHRIAASYDLVRAGLTRKARAALPPREPA